MPIVLIMVLIFVAAFLGFFSSEALGDSARRHVRNLSQSLNDAKTENQEQAVRYDLLVQDYRQAEVQNQRLTKRLAEARKARDEARAWATFWHHEHIDWATKANRELNAALTDLGHARRVQRNTDAQLKSARTALAWAGRDTDPAPAPSEPKIDTTGERPRAQDDLL